MPKSAWTVARARLGAAIRDGAPDERVAQLRAELDAAVPAREIQKIRDQVAALRARGMTVEQQAELAAILKVAGECS